MQATLEAVDGSRLGGFFVQIVPLGIVRGKRIFVSSCGRQDAVELARVVASPVIINPAVGCHVITFRQAGPAVSFPAIGHHRP